MSSSWPELGKVQNKSKFRTANSFAGALKKQSIPVDVSSNSTSVNVPNLNIKKDKNNLDFEEWKEQQKVKRQVSKREKKLLKEEEFRRQMVAPKGYRVQLVQSNIISTPSTSTSEPNVLSNNTSLETAFPILGSPSLPRAKVNVVEQELDAEISELTVLSKTAMKKRKLKAPITINLNQVLVQQIKTRNLIRQTRRVRRITDPKPEEILCGNPLDSSKPTRHRGKVREIPKPKKPSALKSVILKHRQIKKLNKRQCQNYIENLCENLENVKLNTQNICENNNESCNKEVENIVKIDEIQENVVIKEDLIITPSDMIHSTRFRTYCDHLLDPSLDDAVRTLLKTLVSMQDKAYAKDQLKARLKKKFLTGLHEARKTLILKRVLILIIAPDLESCPVPGGLDDKISELISLAQANEIPYVFALGRRKIGHVLYKKVPVSCVSIINVAGAETQAADVTSKLPDLRERYNLAMGKSTTKLPEVLTQPSSPETKTPDVNKIVISSLLSALEESLQKPRSSPFLQAIENAEDSD